MKNNKLIIRRNSKGKLRVIARNPNGNEICLMGVVKVHFIPGSDPEIVITVKVDDIDAEVEISEALCERLREQPHEAIE